MTDGPVSAAPIHDRGGASCGDTSHLLPGEMVPGTRYRIVRRLGAGGMGVVYEALHLATERRAALKILRTRPGFETRAIERFRQEARLASQIDSAAIVKALDFTELPDGRLVYAMELVDGEPLDCELADGPLSPARSIAVLRQVAQALSAAHRAGVVHRDIKPENIMLTDEGGRRDCVRLLDFGVAAVVSGLREGRNDPVGTPHFIAPELILGLDPDHRVDIYSLGCTAFEMLTGTLPRDGPRIEDIMRAHLVEPVPELPGVAAPLAAVIKRCLARDPDERFADVRDFEAALIEAQVACGIVTEWDHLPPPDVEPERRAALLVALGEATPPVASVWRPVAAGGLVLALLAGIGAAVGGSIAGDDPTNASDSAAASDNQVPVQDDAEALRSATLAAREAAQLGRFVYPPMNEPGATTAYQIILSLEGWGTPAARHRATSLRLELAQQLRETADDFWLLAPDSPLVADYYASVLVFAPDDPIARRRSGLDPAQSQRLAERAAAGEFERDELIRVEPLAIFLEKDPARFEARKADYMDSIASMPRAPRYAAAFDTLLVVRLGAAAESGDAGLDRSEDRPSAGAGQEPAERGRAASEDHGAVARREANRVAERGARLMRSGDAVGARAAFERALELNPRLSAAHDGLGELSFSRSNYAAAARHGKKAVAYSPGNLDSRIRLGDALFKLGDYEAAIEHYQYAADRGRSDARRRVEKARAKL